jgi:hypothetical protein
MKKYILIPLMLAAFNINASSNWTFIDKSSSGSSFFVERNSIQKSGDSRTFWTLRNFAERDSDGDLSSKVQRTINCRTREIIIRHFMTYDDLNTNGKLTFSGPADKSKWEPVAPDTINWALLEFVCK